LCRHDIDLQRTFNVSCRSSASTTSEERTETSGTTTTGGSSSSSHSGGQQQPYVDASSFRLAKDKLCAAGGGCVGVMEDMLTDIRTSARERENAASAEVVPVPVIFHFSLQQMCDSDATESDGIRLCDLLPFAEYAALETEADADPDPSAANGVTCCEASAIVTAELMKRANKVTFERVCPEGKCDAVLEMSRTNITQAKAVLQSSLRCLDTTWHVLQKIQKNEDISRGSLDHFTKEHLVNFVDTDDVCWLQWHLSSKPVDMSRRDCEAADAVLAQHLWLYHPAVAPGVYSSENGVLDDGMVALALSSLCAREDRLGALDRVVSGHIGFLLEGALSFQAMCEEPCRCTTDVLEAVGCGFHTSYDETLQKRPFCYVADPESCARATPSSLLGGKSWAFCSVGFDTCQAFLGSVGPCSPFIPESADVYVPAGTTLETLQHIPDPAQNSITELLGVDPQNTLGAWLVEAALVSSSCYATHGQFICDSRFRRCKADKVSPEPQPLCRQDCNVGIQRKLEHCAGEVVHNDLLQDFDDAGIVCNLKLLPSNLDSFDSGLEPADSAALRAVLGVDRLIEARVVASNVSHFGAAVYAVPRNDWTWNTGGAQCFSSMGPTGGAVPPFDRKKALQQVSCPAGFAPNMHYFGASDDDGIGGSVDRGLVGASAAAVGHTVNLEPEMLCVGPCPSVVYSETQYWALWAIHSSLGSFALVVNGLAVYTVFFFGKDMVHRTDFPTLLLIVLACAAGVVGSLPLLFLQKNLLCSCATELCFQSDLTCAVNKLSTHILLAVMMCLCCKFVVLLHKLQRNARVTRSLFNDGRALQLSWLVPCMFAVSSFYMEEDNANQRLHLARSGAKCQFRYPSTLHETVMLHLPLLLCVGTMAYFIVTTLTLCMRIVSIQGEGQGRYAVGLLLKHIRDRSHMKKMLCISFIAVLLLVLWTIQTITSRWAFQHFFDSMDEWLQCVRFDFARRLSVGDDSVWDEAILTFDGTQCPPAPEGGSLFLTQVARAMFEGLMPCVVAIGFSWRILHSAFKTYLQQRKVRKGRGAMVRPGFTSINSGSRPGKEQRCCDPNLITMVDLEGVEDPVPGPRHTMCQLDGLDDGPNGAKKGLPIKKGPPIKKKTIADGLPGPTVSLLPLKSQYSESSQRVVSARAARPTERMF
jgi:hypothetical protein